MGERSLALMHLDRVDRDGRAVHIRLFILWGAAEAAAGTASARPNPIATSIASRRARVTKRFIKPPKTE
jgi:hypothetical protein